MKNKLNKVLIQYNNIKIYYYNNIIIYFYKYLLGMNFEFSIYKTLIFIK